MSEMLKTPEPQANEAEGTSPQVEKKTPSKRGRMSFIERAQKESEELVKNMGGSLELEGGRRTRSSTRGTPSRPAVVTPPPAKKARNSPVSPKSTPRARGRGRKLDTSETPEPPEQPVKEKETEKLEPSETTVGSPEAKKKADEKQETNGPENPEEPVNDKSLEKPKETETEAQRNEVVQPAAKNKDQVDHSGASVETVQEDKREEEATPNEVSEDTKPKEPNQNESSVDSPMEVDEQPGPKDVEEKPKPDSSKAGSEESEKIVETVEPLAKIVESVPEPATVQKEPTPEPMEVDSSSKSSDVIECTDVVEAEVSNKAPQGNLKSSAEQKIEKPELLNDSSSVVGKVLDVLPSSLTNSEKNGTTDEVNDNIAAENDAPGAPVELETKSVDAHDSTEDYKIDSVIESKTENNIDESKCNPPQSNVTGDAAVTTT